MKQQKILLYILILISSSYLSAKRIEKSNTKKETVRNIKSKVLPNTNESSNNSKDPVNNTTLKGSLSKIAQNNEEGKSERQTPEEIFLSFENAELINFVNYIADLKKWNLIPDKSMAGNKISLTMREPVTIAQAEKVFYTVLDKAGYAISKVGDVYKIVPKDKRTREPLKAFINVDPETLPNNDNTIRYVSFLENIRIQDINNLVRSLLDPTAMVIEQPDLNCLIIADKSLNIKSCMKIIKELDKTGLKETVAVVRLQHANAIDVQELFKSLIEEKPDANPLARLLGKKAEGSAAYFPPTTRIIAEERMNSLILLGTTDSIDKIINFIRNHVDIALQKVESPLHIYELQYADAKQIVTLLNEAMASPESQTGQSASKFGAVRGGVKYFKKMTIQADQQGNRILVSCSDKNDWKLLKETIRDLDKAQPQVAIETMIVSVDIEDEKLLGGRIRNKKPGQIGTGIDFQGPAFEVNAIQKSPDGTNVSILGNLISVITGQLGKTILTFGKRGNIWAVFEAIRQDTNSTLIAKPFLNISNKYKASAVVGTIKRIVTQTTTTGTSGFNDASANLTLEIKPQINIDGIINMSVLVKLDQFTDPSGLNQTKRSVSTNISIADGQVLALGGLILNQVTENEVKTPILGDIPLISWFFKSKEKVTSKTSLLVFLCPTIVKPRTTPGINVYSRMKIDSAKDLIDSTMPTVTRDPINNWFFNPDQKSYSRKVEDYADARYQPVTVDIKNDPFYRTRIEKENESEYDKKLRRAKANAKDEDKFNTPTKANA